MPGRVEAADSDLTGDQLKAILQRFRVPVTRFAKHAGVHEVTAQKYVYGKQKIPLWVEWLLWVYDKHPEMRLLDRDLSLPVAHWLSAPAPEHTQRRRRSVATDDMQAEVHP